MRRWRTITLAISAAALTILGSAVASTVPTVAAQAAPLSTKVQLFYYPWYGNPSVAGSYRHWQQGGRTPPADVGADFYPKLGAYDSGDFAGAVDQHMAWIQRSGAGTLVYSWWGQGSYEDNLAPGVLAAAAKYGIKVAWHLEPYGGRTAESTVSDVNYLNSRYGGSPAYYRDAEHGNRPAFYVFESLRITDWTPIEALKATNIILAQTTDTSKVAHFGGMYTYDAIAGATAPGWKNAGDFCEANGLVWAPSVGPGYIDDRAVVGNTTPTLGRENGATYDKEWQNAVTPSIGGNPDWVSVTSFNEWHEGSVLEPASSAPPAGQGYLTFEGAYGKTGAAAETSYLDRTRYWVDRFDPGTVQPNTNLALRKQITASGAQGGFPASAAVDGNAGTYWESANNAFPQSLTVDLGAATSVGRVVLKLPGSWGSRTQTLSILGSANGSAYSTVAGSRGYTFDPAAGNSVTVTFPATTQRYLRLTVTGNTGWPAGQASELEAYRE
jgi:glycoprotein endo-alpha-1,2-mannosidase